MAYEIMEVEIIMTDLADNNEKAIKAYQSELLGMRAGRASQHILDKVVVDYYGTPTPLNQMANISIPEARLLVVSVWDQSAIKAVEKAIIAANIGIFPSTDGKLIRMVFPELTEERRRQLSKDIKALSEKVKVAVRNNRRDAVEEIRKLKKDSIVTEDEQVTFEKDIDKATTTAIERLDKLTAEKEKEVMSV